MKSKFITISFILLLMIFSFTFSVNLKVNNNNIPAEVLHKDKIDYKGLISIWASESAFFVNSGVQNDNYNKQLVGNIRCSVSNTCKPSFGVCLSESECLCNYGFTNYRINNNIVPNSDGSYCSYEQKTQITLFLLEGLFPTGIGYLYLENYLLGTLKMLICSTMFILCLFLRFKVDVKVNDDLLKLIIIGLVFLMGFWQMLDITLIVLNKYRDANNMPLASFSSII